MKTFLVITISSVSLFFIGSIIYGSYNADKAREFRNKQLAERHASYTPNEYWPDRSDVKKVVTYAKPKVVAKTTPTPLPASTPTPSVASSYQKPPVVIDLLNPPSSYPSPTPHKRVAEQRHYGPKVAVIYESGKEPVITTWVKNGVAVVVDNPKDYYRMLNSN
jgi:hypothetical protein